MFIKNGENAEKVLPTLNEKIEIFITEDLLDNINK